jgi:AraC family transcriptional regulator
MSLDNKSRQEYISRIRRVQEFIRWNIDGDLSLDRLSSVACFSKFYFNRIFSALVGESLNAYVMRIRVESSAFALLHKPQEPITAIAYDYGFSSPAVYSRAFRDRYAMTPTQWRKVKQKSKICKVESTICKAVKSVQFYIDSRTHKPRWRIDMNATQSFNIEIREMPEIFIAYVRHKGAYDPMDKSLFQTLFARLLSWATPKGLFNPPSTKAITLYSSGHPDTTEPENLCVDACISIAPNTLVSGEINKSTIPEGLYAVISVNDATPAECGEAWNQVFNSWLPESGYQPGQGAYYINHLNDPEQHPQKLHTVEMYLPVKPLH